MGNRRKSVVVIVLVLALVVGFAGFVLVSGGPREPMYEGKPLSFWLEGFNHHYAFQGPEWLKAEEAMEHVGTNAIPTLLRMAAARDSALKLKLLNLAGRQHVIRIHYVSASTKRIEAWEAFHKIGLDGRDAVPVLVLIYESSDPGWVKVSAAKELGDLGGMASNAVPVLLRDVTSADVPTRRAAVAAVGRIKASPQLAIPAVSAALNDRDREVRLEAAAALQNFGPDAKTALPVLRQLRNDPDPAMREAVQSAIENIDPQTARKILTHDPPDVK